MGAADFMAFARVVWLWTIAADLKGADRDLGKRIAAHCRAESLYRPEEDVLPAILEPILFRYLAALGIGEVTLWNEWRAVSRQVTTDTFAASSPATIIPEEKLCAIAAPGLLLSWQHDDVYGLLALKDDLRHRADPETFFEGFWAGLDNWAVVFDPDDDFGHSN